MNSGDDDGRFKRKREKMKNKEKINIKVKCKKMLNQKVSEFKLFVINQRETRINERNINILTS